MLRGAEGARCAHNAEVIRSKLIEATQFFKNTI